MSKKENSLCTYEAISGSSEGMLSCLMSMELLLNNFYVLQAIKQSPHIGRK
ncbi:hypothetical protein [Paenibacillus polymyxa]|uniref:hypothetical protein n=1 Tax=Paenibacillus polymyxa TaxID=1406 RepID=UPI0003F93294|nr:hypothetical protein [Paenibacillus polymyxa]